MTTLPSLADTAKLLRAQKTLGQNFLLDQGLCDSIAHALTTDAEVIEIGPGPGGLTRALLTHGKKVTAIDLDARMINALSALQSVYPDQLSLLEGNALRVPLTDFATPLAIVGNLPFNISTELLLRWLPQGAQIAEMLLMFQAEVAARIIAQPHSKPYGRLSILSQYLMHIYEYCPVPSTAFTPAPKVNASVLHFQPRADLQERLGQYARLNALVKVCFSARRKTLARGLKGKIADHTAMLENAEISLQARPEDLSIEEYLRLEAVINRYDAAI